MLLLIHFKNCLPVLSHECRACSEKCDFGPDKVSVRDGKAEKRLAQGCL